jgi:hypothetical protein
MVRYQDIADEKSVSEKPAVAVIVIPQFLVIASRMGSSGGPGYGGHVAVVLL